MIIFFNKGSAVNGPDEQGEICVKSPQCFIGYLNQTEKNKDVNNIFMSGPEYSNIYCSIKLIL